MKLRRKNPERYIRGIVLLVYTNHLMRPSEGFTRKHYISIVSKATGISKDIDIVDFAKQLERFIFVNGQDFTDSKIWDVINELPDDFCDVKPKPSEYEARKKKKARRKFLKQVRKKRKKEFYGSKEWRSLRYKALRKHGGACQCCGAKPPDTILHVDHVIPRSKRPDLELHLDNLQVLCEDCNLGKSNKYQDDWR